MSNIKKKIISVTKVFLVGLLISGISLDSFAQKEGKNGKKKKKAKQEKVIERPVASGDANTDAFVKSSFDIYEQNQEISKKLSDVKGNAGDAKQIKADLETQASEIAGLLGKSKDVVNGAKAITPKSNSMKAVGAVNKAIKALNAAKNAIPGQMEQIKSQGGK